MIDSEKQIIIVINVVANHVMMVFTIYQFYRFSIFVCDGDVPQADNDIGGTR